jgi:hypothetical protein
MPIKGDDSMGFGGAATGEMTVESFNLASPSGRIAAPSKSQKAKGKITKAWRALLC